MGVVPRGNEHGHKQATERVTRVRASVTYVAFPSEERPFESSGLMVGSTIRFRLTTREKSMYHEAMSDRDVRMA